MQSDLYGGQFDPARDSEEKLLSVTNFDPESILIYEENGEILGTVSLIENGRVAWLFRFAVTECENEKTITKALYETACNILRYRGHKQILIYSPSNHLKLNQRYIDLGMNKGGEYTCHWQDIRETNSILFNEKEYKSYYTKFAQNVYFAARTLYYFLNITQKAVDKNEVHNVLEYNAQFWNDYNFMTIQSVVIFLGKIFDDDTRSYSLKNMLKKAVDGMEYFSRASLRKRKIELAGTFEGIEEYIQNSHELSNEDIKNVKLEVNKARKLWFSFKPIRDKIYAHNQILSLEEQEKLFKNARYDDLKEIVRILLNIVHIFEQAELNGNKPDFEFNYRGPIINSEKETDKLISLLVLGKK